MKNPHRVPKKQWKKWSMVAQKTFNDVFSLPDPLVNDIMPVDEATSGKTKS